MSYHRRSIGRRRPFVITAGLREGYRPDGVIHHCVEARQAVLRWVMARARAEQPYLTGIITEGALVYAWGSGPEANVGTEPAIMFSGEISASFLADLPDEAVETMLDELAEELARALGQERVYVAYGDRTWALQAD